MIANHVAATVLHYRAFNFTKKHGTLKTTPAVAAGVVDRPLTMLDLVRLIECKESVAGRRLTDYLPSPKSDDGEAA